MCRGAQVTTHALRSRRWRAFAEPVTPEYDPEHCAQVRGMPARVRHPLMVTS